MTIEEAIEHCKEVAKESREAALSYARENDYETAISCKACGQEHEQLEEWLAELKQRREAEITALPKTNADRIRQMTDEEFAECFGSFICNRADHCRGDITCAECKMQWLKQEVSEDAAD